MNIQKLKELSRKIHTVRSNTIYDKNGIECSDLTNAYFYEDELNFNKFLQSSRRVIHNSSLYYFLFEHELLIIDDNSKDKYLAFHKTAEELASTIKQVARRNTDNIVSIIKILKESLEESNEQY